MAGLSGMSSLTSLLQTQAQVSGRKQGQTPSARPSRQQLLLEFDLQRQAQDHGNHTLQYFLCDAYPPSTRTVNELASINISELQVDTRHLGRVLFIRIINTAIRDAAVQNIVQDETGAAERLALYNTDVAARAEQLLPEDAVFAVKEPYYTATANGSFGLRVDHPSDLVGLSSLDPQVPLNLRADLIQPDRSALDYKIEGNAFYSTGDYLAALYSYSQGLAVCRPDDVSIKFDLLRNRAMVNTFLKRFTQALEDAKASIVPASELKGDTESTLNVKAYERAGRAAYELGNLSEAEGCFRKIQELAPTNENTSHALERIRERLREQSTGDYNFVTMSRSASKKHNRLDHTDFTSNTTMREAGVHGRGLFVTKDIAAGELILCERAFCVAFDSDETSQSYAILDHKNKRISSGTQATLLFSSVQKLLHNPELAVPFFDLFDGGDFPKISLQIVDGLVPVDAFRVQAIIQYNCFGCPTVRSSSKSAQKQSSSPAGYHSTGLWLRAAYINHACDGNAMRSFIGDMVIVRAAKDIAKDEEVLMPYRLPDAVNAVTQEDLQNKWGFKCDCGICIAEGASSLSHRRLRSQLIGKTRTLLSAASQPSQNQHDRASTTQVEKLLTKLQSHYDERCFESRPRLGLVAPGRWLCQAYKSAGSQDKVIKSAMALLQDLGYGVTIAGKTVSIDRHNSQLEGTAIDAAMYAAHAFRSRGDTDISNQIQEFAKSLYMIMNGEMRDFEDRYAVS